MLRRVIGSGILAFLLGLAATAADLRAENLKLTGGEHWIALASSRDRNEAIGVARLYGGLKARVVSSKNGWYAVVIGPVSEATLSQYRKTYRQWPQIPADALFSRGDKYIETVWLPPTEKSRIEFGQSAPAHIIADGLDVVIELGLDGDNRSVHLAGRAGTRELFNLETPPDAYADFGTAAEIVRIDRDTTYPQVLATQNTGGAHCCAQTWIATEISSGSWTLVDAGLLDGGGYWAEDVDGEGAYELMSVDNSFLYAFDSYAGSFAPIRISRLSGRRLTDVTDEPQWKDRIAQELAGTEFLARLDPSIWRTNGFLAAWVALKIRLGEGDAAWNRMLEAYDRNSSFGPLECTDGRSVEECPAESLRQIPFPEALAAHLKANGYAPVPE